LQPVRSELRRSRDRELGEGQSFDEKERRMGLFGWGGKKESDSERGQESDGARIASELSIEGDRYIDQGQIAKGGMGSVRRVFNRNLLRREAMKVLDAGVADDENEVLRFLEEAQITGQLDHPNIPPVHDVGEGPQGRYFTMKLVRGQTLEQLLLSPKFDVTNPDLLFQMLQILIKVCEAIAFSHSRGVIHCDLKPPNIMVGKFGQVYVMDWGIARVKGAHRKRKTDTGADLVSTEGRDKAADEGRVMGTLGYMPPEQAHGDLDAIDERTDIFALGGLLYRLLTGRAPHVGRTPEESWELAKACVVAEPQSVVAHRKPAVEIPPRLARIAMKALEADKDLRYAKVSELQRDLEDFVRGAGRHPTVEFKPGQRVIREGEPGDSAYVIVKGKARVFRAEDGKTLRQMGPGEVFGETAVLLDAPRSASIEATEPLTVVQVARSALEAELGKTYWAGLILKALAERFRDLDTRLSAAEKGLEGAVRESVLRYLAFHGEPGPEGSRVVPWTPLRRHIKYGLKLGDMQVMALCAGVRGLHIDARADTATLVRDVPVPVPHATSAVMPAIKLTSLATDDAVPPGPGLLSDKPVPRPASRATPAVKPPTGSTPAVARPPSGQVSALADDEVAPVLSDKPVSRPASRPAPAARPPSAASPVVPSDASTSPVPVPPLVERSPFEPAPAEAPALTAPAPAVEPAPEVPAPAQPAAEPARPAEASKDDPSDGLSDLEQYAATELMHDGIDIDALIAAAEKARAEGGGGEGGGS